MYCHTQCPLPCSTPPLTPTSARDSWTLTGKSGSVSCGVTAPFSWVMVHTTFCLCPPRVYFLVLCKFWQLYGGINGHLLQESLYHTQVCITQSPCPCSRPPPTYISTEDPWTLPGKSGSVSYGALLLSPGSWCTQGSVCALQESVSQSCVSSVSSLVGVTATSSKRAYAIPKSAAPRAPVPVAVHC